MKGLFVLTPQTLSSMQELRVFSGNELVLLVVPSEKELAASFEGDMALLSRRAKEVEELLSAHNIACKTLVEWGDLATIVPKALEREGAELINVGLPVAPAKSVDQIIQERLERGMPVKTDLARVEEKEEISLEKSEEIAITPARKPTARDVPKEGISKELTDILQKIHE